MLITRRYWKFLKDLIVVITEVLNTNLPQGLSKVAKGGLFGVREVKKAMHYLYNSKETTTWIIGQAISDYTPSNNRSQTTTTGSNTVLLDAYNANPSSMTGALKSFAKNIEGDKLVILGDMRELGEYSHEAHKEIVGLCERLGLEALYVGEEFYAVTDGGAKYFATIDDLKQVLEVEVVKGKTVLLKGSRGMRMEQLLPLL